MKNLLFLVAILAFAQISCAQKVKSTDVPAAVKAAFAQKFPTLKAEKWEKEDDGNYEAEFDDANDAEMSATFSASGKWLETESEIAKSALPAAVLAKLADKKVKEAAKIERADGTIVYEAEVKGKDYLFDSAGNDIK